MQASIYNRGISLLELLVSLSIISVILAIGVPALSTVIDNTKRKDTVYEILGMLNFARDMAVSNSRNVIICPSENKLDCSSTQNWSTNLLVFVDQNKNDKKDEDEPLLRTFDMTANEQSLNWKSFQNKSFLSFYADGTTGFQSGRIYYCYKGGQEIQNKAQIIVYRTGRSRIAAREEFKSGC